MIASFLCIFQKQNPFKQNQSSQEMAIESKAIKIHEVEQRLLQKK